jgi:ribonuclease HI
MKTQPETMLPLRDSLDDLINYLGIEKWDAIIAADGSGSRWNYPMGWGCVLIDRMLQRRKLIFGANSVGTNQLAELTPFMFAMDWYANESGPGAFHLRKLREENDPRDLLIHCVSDSEVVVKQGMGEYASGGYRGWRWLALEQLSMLGYRYKWHWIPRELCGLNRLTDDTSRRTRVALQDMGTIIEASIVAGADVLCGIELTRPNIYQDGWTKKGATETRLAETV